jgi:hypothetical protein
MVYQLVSILAIVNPPRHAAAAQLAPICRPHAERMLNAARWPAWQHTKRVKVFWFFFSKKNKRFFLKKEAKTFYPFCWRAGLTCAPGRLAPPAAAP